MRNILKQILYFLRKSYSKPVIGILLLMFFIGISIAYRTTDYQKTNIEQKILERKQEIITGYNEQLEKYEKALEEYEAGKLWRFQLIAKEPIPLERKLSWDSELKELEAIKDASFIILWLENFITNRFFIWAIVIIVALPIIRVLFLSGLYIKKQFQEIQKMATFQKYLIGLLLGVLAVLILILLKLF